MRSIFDVDGNQPVEPEVERAGPAAIVVVDGIFLHRPELRPFWDYSVFLDVDFTNPVRRMGERDGTSTDVSATENRRYVEGQRMYLSRCEPAQYASAVVDYNDPANPAIK